MTGKRRYPDEQHAVADLTRANLKNPWSRRKLPQRAYKCISGCEGWHVSSHDG